MPISIALLAAASLAVATSTPTVQPAPGPSALRAEISRSDVQPAWRTVRSDTLGDLLFATETLNGRVRFTARGVKAPTGVTTSDFTPDSVRTWTKSAADLAAAATPKMGDMRGLGMALTLNVTTTATGAPAFGFYVGDAVNDQQVALALTKENVVKLTTDVNAALDAAGKP
jgi:hypothetical protein